MLFKMEITGECDSDDGLSALKVKIVEPFNGGLEIDLEKLEGKALADLAGAVTGLLNEAHHQTCSSCAECDSTHPGFAH